MPGAIGDWDEAREMALEELSQATNDAIVRYGAAAALDASLSCYLSLHLHNASVREVQDSLRNTVNDVPDFAVQLARTHREGCA